MSDEDLKDLAGRIQKAAPTSKLCQANAAMATSAAAIAAKDAALAADSQVGGRRQEQAPHRHRRGGRDAPPPSSPSCAAGLRRSPRTARAVLPADLEGAGLTYRDVVVASSHAAAVPTLIDVLPSNVRRQGCG